MQTLARRGAGALVATVVLSIVVSVFVSTGAIANSPPGEGPSLGEDRVTQDQAQAMSLIELRQAGERMFTTPFNKLDGFGDGPMDPADTLSPGGRPTLQGNGTFLRVNGLDAQTCNECHSVMSAATVPMTLGVGGVGSSNNNAIIMPTEIDPADLLDFDAAAGLNGRFANPPFLFGAGGVELLALEMTQNLQELAQEAIANPGVPVALETHGVSFGTIVADSFGELDTSDVEGVDDDLVVKPFGRKGEFATAREFDIEAMQFHFGMQPVEVVGQDVDGDGDGVLNEVRIGELSALSAFVTSSAPPQQDHLNHEARRGKVLFSEIGCASCHLPALETEGAKLPLRFPELRTDPQANVFMEVDLSKPPVKFKKNGQGGVIVPLFADLKRHDMGPELAESFALVGDGRNREFTTARLWGIADTAPYLHDGRATTLTEAILLHGGEGQQARDAFDALPASSRTELLTFLRSLRVPGMTSGAPGGGGGPGAAPERTTGRSPVNAPSQDPQSLQRR